MAKPSQTFKKRQRENKLREKAQLKRERRQQRQIERKTSQAIGSEDSGARPEQNQVASMASDDAGIEQDG